MKTHAKLLELALSELEKQKKIMKMIDSGSEDLPKGHLETDRRSGTPSWHHSFKENGCRKKQSIDRSTKEGEQLFQALRLKRACIHNKEKIRKNISLLDDFVSGFEPVDDPLLTGVPAAADPEIWSNEDYRTNPYFRENLKIETSSGRLVRSKTEASIYDALESEGICFRYEAELQLGSNVRYPDFTILHPKTDQIIIWEHDGKLDDPDHTLKYLKNIMLYCKYGFIPYENLIITAETLKEPFSPGKVMKTINKYLR